MPLPIKKVIGITLKVFVGLLLTAGALALHYYYRVHHASSGLVATAGQAGQDGPEAGRLQRQAELLSATLRRGKYSSRYVFLIDMHLPSGKNRFFVYDLNKRSVLMAGLVAHGNGSKAFSLSPSFSNAEGSNCSSLGRYKVGGAYQGQFGRSYLLYGLDSTNSNALVRHVVLHSYDCVPAGEVHPYPICNSKGCTMVAPAFLEKLRPLIDKSSKPILMSLFD